MPKKLLIIDGNAPWVRSLFLAMPNQTEIYFLRPFDPKSLSRLEKRSWSDTFRWEQRDTNVFEQFILIPGWRRWEKVSTKLIAWRANEAAERFGRPDAVVYTLPQYAGVAEKLSKFPAVYYAHDPFQFYAGWDKDRTMAMQDRLMNRCDATFAVSRLLANDLGKRSGRKVFYSPNAADAAFVARLKNDAQEPPADLRDIRRPIVGCVGQINRSYDWNLIASVVDRMADVSFVFVGPINDSDSRIADVLARPNVHSLGARPHESLPAYLAAFDVCFNPLAVNEHNDRRSLLRLYDYLATSRPIVSTAVREAYEHDGLLGIVKDASECEASIRQSIMYLQLDMTRRRAYISSNTWKHRAEQFLTNLSQTIEGRDKPR